MNTLFEKSKINNKDEWLTPPEIIKALGEFDLDPCSPINRPWDTASMHYSVFDDGLNKEWFGRVWLNPPYGKEMQFWLKKMSSHGNGIALTFNRSETGQFFRYVWPVASAILFIAGRIRFYDVDGRQGGTPGCGSVLIAYGDDNACVLESCSIKGKFIRLK